MSLFFAEIASISRKERLERMITALVPDREYLLYPCHRHGEQQSNYVARGVFIKMEGNILYFDRFTVELYSHESLLGVVMGLPKLVLDTGTDITKIVEATT